MSVYDSVCLCRAVLWCPSLLRWSCLVDVFMIDDVCIFFLSMERSVQKDLTVLAGPRRTQVRLGEKVFPNKGA